MLKQCPEDIKKLEDKISRFKEQENQYHKSDKVNETSGTLAVGMKMAADLLSAVLVGAAIGYVIDDWNGTKPIFLAVFLVFGGAAGILNVYRSAKAEDAEKEVKE